MPQARRRESRARPRSGSAVVGIKPSLVLVEARAMAYRRFLKWLVVGVYGNTSKIKLINPALRLKRPATSEYHSLGRIKLKALTPTHVRGLHRE